jgi:hypothetical protein
MLHGSAARVWFLNFDADDELARPRGYSPPRSVLSRFAELAQRVDGLVPSGDYVLAEGAPAAEKKAMGRSGRAFCPTPRALAALEQAGARPERAPSLEILRRVNHRGFCAELGQTLPCGRFVRTMTELRETLEMRRGPWLLKRAFGYAGKGRASLRGSEMETWAMPFVRASLDEGEGLQVEPLVERLADFALHGFVAENRALSLGDPTVADIDERGAWRSTRRVESIDIENHERQALFNEAENAADALRRAGYFGPFGVDAFRFTDGGGSAQFNPRCEINARYSMGWAIGMGRRRPDL